MNATAEATRCDPRQAVNAVPVASATRSVIAGTVRSSRSPAAVPITGAGTRSARVRPEATISSPAVPTKWTPSTSRVEPAAPGASSPNAMTGPGKRTAPWRATTL